MKIGRRLAPALFASSLMLLSACGAQGTGQTSTSTTSLVSTAPTANTTSTTKSPASVDLAAAKAANELVCDSFQEQALSSGMAERLGKYAADVSAVPPAQFVRPIELFQLVQPTGANEPVKSAITAFNLYTKTFYDLVSPKKTDADILLSKYNDVTDACKSFVVPKPLVYALRCTVGNDYDARFDTYQAAWPSQPEHCEGVAQSGTELSDQQGSALAAAHYDDPTSLKYLYGMCATINSYPANIDGFVNGRLSESQVYEAQGMLTLCPDHPEAARVQANIDAAGLASAATSAQAQAEADGTFAKPGKHLVGTDIRPGTWQSVGERVENCYWEISDASGNIIDNNFISVAPQFTVTIPAEAAGFTNSGCSFEWIG